MPQASYGSVATALGPFEGLGFIVFIAIAIILLWEALIVVSVLLAALSTHQRQRARTPPL